MKNNIDNIHCTLSLQFIENLKLYFEKLQKEFDKAVIEMKNFNLKSIPMKVEFESQIKKIFFDIFINHLYPLSIKPENNKNIKNQFSNQSFNQINDLFIYNNKWVKELTEKGKSEYVLRLIGETKGKINILFNQLGLDEGEKEKIEEKKTLKKSFVDNITQSLNEKIVFSSDIYDLCLSYSYISKDLFNILSEKIVEFCENNVFKNKEFKEKIDKRIIQQIDSNQRKALNID